MDNKGLHSVSSSEEIQESVRVETDEQPLAKIPFNTLYSPPKDKDAVFLPGVPIHVKITDLERAMVRSHPFNPNLYTIELTHGDFKWTIRRRYKHFLKLNTELLLFRAKPRKPNTKGPGHLPKFPKRPDTLATHTHFEERMQGLQEYLQNVLDNENYRKHKETLEFLEVSRLSFVHDLGAKRREGILRKRSGGHKFKTCCCFRSTCLLGCCGVWNKRWLVIKDSFIAYINPDTYEVRDVLLMDKEFTVQHGQSYTGIPHGLLISNQTRALVVNCWTERKAREWMVDIVNVMAGDGAIWTTEHLHGSFAPLRPDAPCKWFVDGAGYFDAVALAINDAEEEIFITDWWLSPELHLRRPVTEGNRWRFDQILRRKAESGVHVYVLLYKEVELALGINSAYSKQVLINLHPNIKVLRHPDHLAGSGVVYWAHHEKIVAIDQKIAFIGGLDVCYGRWDDHNHQLTDFGSVLLADKEEKQETVSKTGIEVVTLGMIALNPAGEPGEIKPGRLQSIKNKMRRGSSKKRSGGSAKLWIGKDYSNPIKKDFVELHKPNEDFVDRGSVCRMPWHDIAMCVHGAAARDVCRHFIQRWNFTKMEKVKENTNFPLLLPKSYNMPSSLPSDKSFISCKCQILRSVGVWSCGVSTESSIHQAYLDSIRAAKHFIYIENQFFICSLKDDYVYNKIGDALVERILRAHREGSPFRVIVVMPLLPAFEGEIGAASGTSIQTITHWNYKSICRGNASIYGRLKESGIQNPNEYISFYGLRNHSSVNGKPITELVYVHCKAMIVDDHTVIIGSANVNDRSMLGKRDSEIAAIVEDDVLNVPSKMAGKNYLSGKFAHSLRISLFREHLGLYGTDTDLDILQDPVSEEFYKHTWMSVAARNTDIFEKVFHCLPSDEVKAFADLPWYRGQPCLADTDPEKALRLLQSVQGHLVLMPLLFLENEDLRPATGTSESLLPSKVFT